MNPEPNSYGDLTNDSGLPGQHMGTPKQKLFFQHFIVEISGALLGASGIGPYFDPSYGTVHSSNADFQANAVSGYVEIRTLGGIIVAPPFGARKPDATSNINFIP